MTDKKMISKNICQKNKQSSNNNEMKEEKHQQQKSSKEFIIKTSFVNNYKNEFENEANDNTKGKENLNNTFQQTKEINNEKLINNLETHKEDIKYDINEAKFCSEKNENIDDEETFSDTDSLSYEVKLVSDDDFEQLLNINKRCKMFDDLIKANSFLLHETFCAKNFDFILSYAGLVNLNDVRKYLLKKIRTKMHQMCLKEDAKILVYGKYVNTPYHVLVDCLKEMHKHMKNNKTFYTQNDTKAEVESGSIINKILEEKLEEEYKKQEEQQNITIDGHLLEKGHCNINVEEFRLDNNSKHIINEKNKEHAVENVLNKATKTKTFELKDDVHNLDEFLTQNNEIENISKKQKLNITSCNHATRDFKNKKSNKNSESNNYFVYISLCSKKHGTELEEIQKIYFEYKQDELKYFPDNEEEIFMLKNCMKYETIFVEDKFYRIFLITRKNLKGYIRMIENDLKD